MSLNGDFCLRLTLTLLHFLWQGAAVALFALAAGAVLRRAGAAVRYWVFVTALAVMALCPPVTFRALAPKTHFRQIENAPAGAIPPATEKAGSGMLPLAPGADMVPKTPAITPVRVENAPADSTTLKERLSEIISSDTCRRAAPWVAVGYFAGVLLMLARLLLALRGGRGLRRQSKPFTEPGVLSSLYHAAAAIRLRAVPAVAWCRQVAVPTVVGILKPTILLPLSLSSGLAPEQVAMLLLHELAHLRRYDHWVNLAQWVIETTLFFHPAIWWLSRRIRTERELACDDMVLTAGVGWAPYAESLLRMAELSRGAVNPEQLTALALGSHGQHFSGFGKRILRLIEGRETLESIRPMRIWPLCVVLLGLLAGCFSVALRSSASQQKASTDQDGAAIFSNGIQAVLIGVAIPPNPHECWTPDGKLMLPVPQGYLEDLGHLSFGNPNVICRDFFVRLDHLTNNSDVNVRYELEPNLGTSGGYHTKDGVIELGFVGLAHSEQKMATLHLGVAGGSWKTMASSDGKGGSESGKDEGISYQVLFSPAIQQDRKWSITVSHNLYEKDWRVVAIDEKGTPYTANHSGSPGGKDQGFVQTTFEYMQVPKDARIDRFEFQARGFEWRKIKNIKLQPDENANNSNTERIGNNQFPDAQFVIDNGSHGSGSGLKGDFGPRDGQASCGWPGKASEVKWKYLGKQDGGWKFEFTRRFPIDSPAEHPEATRTTTKEVIYKGGTQAIFEDDNQWIGIELRGKIMSRGLDEAIVRDVVLKLRQAAIDNDREAIRQLAVPFYRDGLLKATLPPNEPVPQEMVTLLNQANIQQVVMQGDRALAVLGPIERPKAIGDGTVARLYYLVKQGGKWLIEKSPGSIPVKLIDREIGQFKTSPAHNDKNSTNRLVATRPPVTLEAHQYYKTGEEVALKYSVGEWKWDAAELSPVFVRIDGKEYALDRSDTITEKSSSTISLNEFALKRQDRDPDKPWLRPGTHTAVIAFKNVKVRPKHEGSGPTAAVAATFDEVVTSQIEYEIVNQIPADYFQAVYKDGWDEVLKQRFAGIRCSVDTEWPHVNINWRENLPFNLAFDIAIQMENESTTHSLMPLTLKAGGSKATSSYGKDELNDLIRKMAGHRVRLLMKPSAQVAAKDPSIRTFYGQPFITDWMRLKPDVDSLSSQLWKYGVSGPTYTDMKQGNPENEEKPLGVILRSAAEGGGVKVMPGRSVRLLPLPEVTSPAEAMQIVGSNPEKLKQSKVMEIPAQPDDITYLALLIENGETLFMLIDASASFDQHFRWWKMGPGLEQVVVLTGKPGDKQRYDVSLAMPYSKQMQFFKKAEGRTAAIQWKYLGGGPSGKKYRFTLRDQVNGQWQDVATKEIEYRERRLTVFENGDTWVGIEITPWESAKTYPILAQFPDNVSGNVSHN